MGVIKRSRYAGIPVTGLARKRSAGPKEASRG
jgi:hypothetical protein